MKFSYKEFRTPRASAGQSVARMRAEAIRYLLANPTKNIVSCGNGKVRKVHVEEPMDEGFNTFAWETKDGRLLALERNGQLVPRVEFDYRFTFNRWKKEYDLVLH